MQLKKPGDNEGDDLISIGYMGSESHTPDLATIAPALLKILNKYQDKIRLEVYGTPLPESLQGQAGVSWHPTPTNIYTEFVKFFQGLNFDLVIAPLADISSTARAVSNSSKQRHRAPASIAGSRL